MQANRHYPTVAIVILNWNGRKYLEKFLPSVTATVYENYNIVVADNHSSDDSVEFLKKNYPEIKRIGFDTNYGFAEGYNRALAITDAQYFVLLNSDVEVGEGWLHPLIALMESDANIAACQPKILSYSDKSKFEYAGASGGWMDRLGYPFCRGRIFGHCEKDVGQYDDVAEVFWASGACLTIRADAFRKMNGFDAYFFAHQEEIDLCWRLKNKGFKIYVQPQSVVYHVGGGSLEMGNKRKVFLNYRNNLITIYKNLPAKDRKRILFLRMLLDGLAAVQFLLTGKGGSFLAVVRAHAGYYKWRAAKSVPQTGVVPAARDQSGFFDGSIVVNYFLRSKKIFSSIIPNKK